MIGDEPGGAYNRLQLSNVLAGLAGPASIELADEQWYAAQGDDAARRHRRRQDRPPAAAAVPVQRSRRAVRRARARDRQQPGAAAGRRPGRGDGQLLPGAVAFRTLADCARSRARRNGGRAVVLGGGVLGLETARGLAGRGLPVTLVQRGRWLMERQLDAGASRVLTRTVRSLGVTVRPGAGVRAVRGGEPGHRRRAGRRQGARTPTCSCCAAATAPGWDSPARRGWPSAAGVMVDDQLRSVTDPASSRSASAPSTAAGRTGWSRRPGSRPGLPHRSCPRGTGGTGWSGYAGSVTVTRLKAAGIELASPEARRMRAGDVEVIRSPTAPAASTRSWSCATAG